MNPNGGESGYVRFFPGEFMQQLEITENPSHFDSTLLTIQPSQGNTGNVMDMSICVNSRSFVANAFALRYGSQRPMILIRANPRYVFSVWQIRRSVVLQISSCSRFKS